MLIATDPLSLLFIACFLFGLLFLLVSALLGNIGHGPGHTAGHSHIAHVGSSHVIAHSSTSPLHAGHGHITSGSAVNTGNNFFSSLFGYISPISIALFLLGFGFFGYVFHNTSLLGLPLILLLAGICGLIIAGMLLVLVNRLFSSTVEPVAQDVTDRTGLLGRVSITIPEKGLGEIIYVSPAGMRKSIPARSIDGRKLERDQEVVVVNYQSGIAEVDTWEHFINQDTSATPDPATTEDLDALRALLDDTATKNSQYVMERDVPKE